MAVLLKIKKHTKPENPLKKKVMLKIKKTINNQSPFQKDTNIRGPIGFLNSYYESPEFKRKTGDSYDYDAAMVYYKAGSAAYNPKIVEKEEDGSHSIPAHILLKSNSFGKKGKPTIVLDKSQAKEKGLNLLDEVLPHEYSHTTRVLNQKDELKFINKNKTGRQLNSYFKHYQSDPEGASTGKSFSDWYFPIGSHLDIPSENYSDLNTLRYELYKYGIYDARKGSMNIEHLKKALNDPRLKNSFILNRLLKSFKPEDIVELNNTIAMNLGASNQNSST